jgi:hypothetical protein
MAVNLTNEQTFKVDNYNQPHEEIDISALAVRLNTLILMDKGTMPLDPDMGVGIRDFQFEYGTNETMGRIKQEIESQISTYIPVSPIYNIDLVIDKDPDLGKKVIYIKFDLINTLQKNKSFVISYKAGNNTNNIVSQIYI